MSEKAAVNVQYKLSFLIKLCLILIISSIVSGVIFYNFVNYEVGQSFTDTRFVIKSVKDFLFPSLWFSITIFSLLLSLGTIVISIFVSHKIAGPIYRIEVTLKDFKAGTFYKIHLRTKDQIRGFVRLLNEFVDSLTHNFTIAKNHTANIKEMIDEGKNLSSKDEVSFEQISSLSEKLKDEIKEIKDVMANYKT